MFKVPFGNQFQALELELEPKLAYIILSIRPVWADFCSNPIPNSELGSQTHP